MACSKFSPVPGPCLCRRVDVAKDRVAGRAARRLALAQHARTAGTKLVMAEVCLGRWRDEGLRRETSTFEQSLELPIEEPIGGGYGLAEAGKASTARRGSYNYTVDISASYLTHLLSVSTVQSLGQAVICLVLVEKHIHPSIASKHVWLRSCPLCLQVHCPVRSAHYIS